jgi:hypothetical protein
VRLFLVSRFLGLIPHQHAAQPRWDTVCSPGAVSSGNDMLKGGARLEDKGQAQTFLVLLQCCADVCNLLHLQFKLRQYV